MRREDLADLSVFLAVAEERSFTKAAARLGVSQSALSHTVRRLEARLGLRLLTRTTRSVAPTEAGEQLLDTLRPAFGSIDARLAVLSEQHDRPAGTVRINSSRHAAETILWPAISRLLSDYPDVKVEIAVNDGLNDIVGDGFDAGVRLGEHLAKDMIAVPIGPSGRMAVVGAPAYFARHNAPKTPHDLTAHHCINLRLATRGDLYAWEFEAGGRELRVRVNGALILNDASLILKAALDGHGLSYLLHDHFEPYLADGRLVQVLEEWCPPFAGYHLYYPSRLQQSSAFAVVVEALRYRPRDVPQRERRRPPPP